MGNKNIIILSLNLPIKVKLNLLVEVNENSKTIILENSKTGYSMEFSSSENFDNIKEEYAQYVWEELKDLHVEGILTKAFHSWNINFYPKGKEYQMFSKIKSDISVLNKKEIELVKKEKVIAEYSDLSHMGDKNIWMNTETNTPNFVWG